MLTLGFFVLAGLVALETVLAFPSRDSSNGVKLKVPTSLFWCNAHHAAFIWIELYLPFVCPYAQSM